MHKITVKGYEEAGDRLKFDVREIRKHYAF